MSLKAKVEAIIYAAEDPITLEQIASLLRTEVLADVAAAKASTEAAAAEAAAESAEEAAVTGEAAATESAAGEISPELAADEEPAPEAGPLMEFNGDSEGGAADENSSEEQSAPEAQAEAGNESNAPEAAAPVTKESAAATEAADEPAEAVAASAEVPTASSTAEPSPEPAPAASASVQATESTSRKRAPKKTEAEIAEDKAVRTRLREVLAELIADYSGEERGIEVRQVAGGFRMATKPEHHDVVRAFAKSLKPPIRLSLAALETLAVIAYKQPITAPEITDIRGVESGGVIGTLLDRKLITTAGRKQVIGRPMQYKTSKEFLLRFGLYDVNELPSMEEFSQLASDVTAIEAAPAEPTLFETQPTDGESEESANGKGTEATETVSNEAATAEAVTKEAVTEEAVTEEATANTAAAEAQAEEAAPEAATSAAEQDQSETESAPEQEPAGRE